jgi:hypothetical protein
MNTPHVTLQRGFRATGNRYLRYIFPEEYDEYRVWGMQGTKRSAFGWKNGVKIT